MSLQISRLSAEQLKRAHEIFGVPEQFDEVADLMVREVEWQIVLIMGKTPMTDKELRLKIEENRLSAAPYQFIKELFARAIINRVVGAEEPSWVLGDFYRRYSYYAQFEYYDFGRLPKELIDALYDWQMGIYLSIVEPQGRANVNGEDIEIHNQEYLTLDEAYKQLEAHPDTLYVIPCNCKCQKYFHDRLLCVCMRTEVFPNSEGDRGLGEPLTLEEAKRRTKLFNESGLMQNGEDGGYCNCDGLCCFPQYMANKVGSRYIYPKSNWAIDFHRELCDDCGDCTRICNFEAFYKDENGKVQYDVSKCWGCTICSENCPKNAIRLVPRQAE